MKVNLSTFLIICIILIAIIVFLGVYIYQMNPLINGKNGETELLNKVNSIEQKIDQLSNNGKEDEDTDEKENEENKSENTKLSSVGLEIKDVEPIINRYFDYVFSIEANSLNALIKLELLSEERGQADFEKIELPDQSYNNNHKYLLTNVVHSEFIEKITSEIMTKECFEKNNKDLVVGYDGKACVSPIEGTSMITKIVAIDLDKIEENNYSYNVKIQQKSEDHEEWKNNDLELEEYNITISSEGEKYIVSDCEKVMK